MNSRAMAQSYLRQAAERLRHAEEALESGNYPYTIRQSQELVEFSLKAALRFAGIEAPKWHDVGPVLRRNTQRFPEWFRSKINELASISRRLRREREPSMYGDEESGLSPDELYTREDALTALTDAEKVYKLCIKLLKKASAIQ